MPAAARPEPAASMLALLPPFAQVGNPDYFGWVIAAALVGASLFAVGRASRRG